MAGNVHAGFSLKLRGRIREQNTAQIREGLYSSITKSLLKIRYSWLHLSAEWCSAAFPGSIPAHQACRDLLAGFNTIITWGKCRVHLVLLWHLPSPLGSPRSSRHSGNRRGSHLESQGLRNYLLSLARSLHKLQERGKKLSERSDCERHQGLPSHLPMAAVCRSVAGTPTVFIHGTGQRSLTTWGHHTKGVTRHLSEFLQQMMTSASTQTNSC